MKTLFIIIAIILTAIFSINMFSSKFSSGDCIENVNDGYVWQINKYSFGKYTAMGWQGNGWGNSVDLEKNILERKSPTGSNLYEKVACPQLTTR